MENENKEILRDLVFYLRQKKLPIQFTIQMAKNLFNKVYGNDKALRYVSDNDRLQYILNQEFNHNKPQNETIKLTKDQNSTYHSKGDIITVDCTSNSEVFINLENTEFYIREKTTNFPLAGIEIESENIKEGDIYGNHFYVLVFTNLHEQNPKFRVLENINRTQSDNQIREYDFTLNEQRKSFGRNSISGDKIEISIENYVIERSENNEFKITHNEKSKQKLIKFFHNAYTLGQTDSDSIKTSCFWFSNSVCSLSLI